MGTQTIQIAYPSGISPDLAAKLSAAADGANTFGGQASNGAGTLSSVMSDVSTVMAQIVASNKGQSITALASFWDGPGAIGSGGVSTGGVISDGSKAYELLYNLNACMPGVSGAINDEMGAIKSGLSAIATIQANPGKQWTQSEASALEQQISGLESALASINNALLGTASAIEQETGQLKFGTCASGVKIGDTTKKILTGAAVIGAGAAGYALGKRAASRTGASSSGGGGGGGGGEPPVTTGGGGDGSSGETPGEGGGPGRLSRFARATGNFIKTNAPVAAIVGTANSVPAAVADLTKGKDPLTDPSFLQIWGANLAQGLLAGPVLKSADGILGRLGLPITPGNRAIVQSLLGGGLIGASVAGTPWLIGKLRQEFAASSTTTLNPSPSSSPSTGESPSPSTGESPSPSTGESPSPSPTTTPTPTPTNGQPVPTPGGQGPSTGSEPTGQPQPTPTPTSGSPTPTPTPTSGSPSPTPTSGSPSPTPTSGSPSPTPTSGSPSPTPTPTTTSGSPSPTPTATSGSPSPTPTYTSGSPTPTATSGSPWTAPWVSPVSKGHHHQPSSSFVSTGNPAAGSSAYPTASSSAQQQASTPTYQFVPTAMGGSSSSPSTPSLSTASSPAALPGGGSPGAVGGLPSSAGGSPVPVGGSASIPVGTTPSSVPTGSSPMPASQIIGITQGQFEIRYWSGQQYSTAFVAPVQLPHWLEQHGISSMSIPTTTPMPVTGSYTPTIIGVTRGEFQVQYWNGDQYSTTLVRPQNLLSWLEQQGDYTVNVESSAAPATVASS